MLSTKGSFIREFAGPALLLSCALSFLTFFGAPLPAPAAVHIVTSHLDSGPGTLREAVALASSGDEIRISTSSVIVLSSTTISIGIDLEIAVQSITQAVIEQAFSTGSAPLIWVSAGTVSLQNLQIRNVNSSNDAGVILQSGGDLYLNNCLLRNNTNKNGGVIRAEGGLLAIESSTFANNHATMHAGAIYVGQADLRLNACHFVDNTADNHGGVLYIEQAAGTSGNITTVFLEACTFTSNTAAMDGGVIFSEGGGARFAQITMIKCVFDQNSAVGQGGVLKLAAGRQSVKAESSLFDFNSAAEGGAMMIADAESVSVTSCTFSNNSVLSGSSGGAINQQAGQVFCSFTEFKSNFAQTHGGAVYQGAGMAEYINCEFDGNETRSGNGGAVNYSGGACTIDRCTMSNNAAIGDGGGLAVFGGSGKVFNSTISANLAGRSGGGIYVGLNQLDIRSCTITKNVADNDNDGSGEGGGFWGETKLFLSNIIANNSDRGGEFHDLGNVLSSDGYNLVGTVGQYNFSSNTIGDQYGDPLGVTPVNPGALESGAPINALLNPLNNNGGFTRTHALQVDSPAINKSTSAGVSLSDQRGTARFVAPDIGAFEFEPIIVVLGSTTPCLNATQAYAIIDLPSVSYNWQVSGGTIASGHSTNRVVVDWSSTIGSLRVNMQYQGVEIYSTHIHVTPSRFLATIDYRAITENTVTSFNVLFNDFGFNRSLIFVSPASNGTIRYTPQGLINYTPNQYYRGIERLEYTLSNEGCSTSGTIIIAVGGQQEYRFLVDTNPDHIRRDGVDGVNGMSRASDVVMSPDGRFAYVAGQLEHSIARFAMHPTNGPVYLGRTREGRRGVRGLTYVYALSISPDGRHLYASSYSRGSIAIFERDLASGDLQYIDKLNLRGRISRSFSQPRDIAISSDGKSVYVTSYRYNAIAVLGRNSSSGLLTYIEVHKNGRHGVDGISQPVGVDVSIDGRSVYVCSSTGRKLAHFERNLRTGSLTYIGRYSDSNIDGLNGAVAVSISPDGRNVYVAGNRDDAVVVFNRNSEDGTLTHVETIEDDSGNVDGLDGISNLKVTPDGSSLFTTSYYDNSLAFFARHPDGTLRYEGNYTDGASGADALRGAAAVAFSPDSRTTLCAGYQDDAISTFERDMLPIATADSPADLRVNTSINIDVLNNDWDPDGGDLTIVLASESGDGAIQIIGGGTSLRYSAGPSAGLNTIFYSIMDEGGNTATATSSIGVVLSKLGVMTEAEVSQNVLNVNLAPNPARESVKMYFELNERADVTVEAFDLQGRSMFGIKLDEIPAGEHSQKIELRQASGAHVPSGAYLLVCDARLESGANIKSSQLLIVP